MNAAPPSALAPVHRTIVEVAQAHPTRLAVVAADGTLTYAQLEASSRRLAWRLVEHCGLRAQQPVAICLPAGCDLPVAVLGVLRAGGYYVPLDPSYPRERLALMLADSGATALLTPDGTAPEWGGATAAACLAVHDPQADGPADDPTNPGGRLDVDVPADHLAYAIYTSGSSGRPKPVGVEHRHLAYSTWARHHHYGHPPEVFALLSSPAFDSSVAGLFWTLTGGGTLFLPDRDVADLPSWLDVPHPGLAVTDLLAVPSAYSMLLETVGPDRLAHLRRVVVAGEACPRTLVARHFTTVPHATLHNEYGPTETTVWATVHECTSTDSGPVPIGRAIAGCSLHVVDGSLRRVPEGAAGELLIEGPGVAQGYLRDTELTRQRFLDPRQVPWLGARRRLYRTGDLVRVTNGDVEFLGRSDGQVKINGHRVELGEIEHTLSSLSGGLEAVATVSQRSGIVGFLRGRPIPPLTCAALVAAARDVLPRHMAPSSITLLPDFPRLPNGKVDRMRLQEQADAAQQPATPSLTADIVRRAWTQALGTETDDVDDFFRCGGDSIAAIRLIAATTAAGVRLELRDMFRHRTLGALIGFAESRVPTAMADAR